jgi:hypothetical protein
VILALNLGSAGDVRRHGNDDVIEVSLLLGCSEEASKNRNEANHRDRRSAVCLYVLLNARHDRGNAILNSRRRLELALGEDRIEIVRSRFDIRGLEVHLDLDISIIGDCRCGSDHEDDIPVLNVIEETVVVV